MMNDTDRQVAREGFVALTKTPEFKAVARRYRREQRYQEHIQQIMDWPKRVTDRRDQNEGYFRIVDRPHRAG